MIKFSSIPISRPPGLSMPFGLLAALGLDSSRLSLFDTAHTYQ